MSCFRRRSKKDKLIKELDDLLLELGRQYQCLDQDLKREKEQRSELEKTQQEQSRQQQQQVIQLQAQRSALETALLQASESSTSAQRQLEDTVQEKTALQEALVETTGQLQKAHEEIQALKATNAEDAERYMSIVTKFEDEKQVMFDRHQEENSLLTARILDANSYVDKLKAQIQEQEIKMRTDASQLKESLAKTRKELEECRANLLMKNSIFAEMEAENAKVKAENSGLKTNILEQESELKRLLTAQNTYTNEALEKEEAVKEARRTSDHAIQELRKKLELKDKMISKLEDTNQKEKEDLTGTQKRLEECHANLLQKNSFIAEMEEYIANLKAENKQMSEQCDDWVEKDYDKANEAEEEREEMETIKRIHQEEIQRLTQSLEASEKERAEIEKVAKELLEEKYLELTAQTESKERNEASIKKETPKVSITPFRDLDESAKKHIRDLQELFNRQIQESAVRIKQLEAKVQEQRPKKDEQDKDVSRTCLINLILSNSTLLPNC